MKFDVRFYLVSLLFIIFDLRLRFCFPGRWRFANRRLRVLVDDGVPCRPDRRLRLRMEERSTRMGLNLPSQADGPDARPTRTSGE